MTQGLGMDRTIRVSRCCPWAVGARRHLPCACMPGALVRDNENGSLRYARLRNSMLNDPRELQSKTQISTVQVPRRSSRRITDRMFPFGKTSCSRITNTRASSIRVQQSTYQNNTIHIHIYLHNIGNYASGVGYRYRVLFTKPNTMYHPPTMPPQGQPASYGSRPAQSCSKT